MVRIRRSIVGTMVTIGMAAACSGDPAGPAPDAAVLGIISWGEAPAAFLSFAGVGHGSDWPDSGWSEWPPLVAPDTVARGVPFTVRITTPLPDGCWRPGGHEKELGAALATITAYDRRTDSEICLQLFGWNSREIELRFDEPGPALIRLIGRRITGDDVEGGEEFVLDHEVIVD